MDKMQEKEALKALLVSLLAKEDEEEAGPYVEERRETSVSPEEVEGELYDEGQDITEDAEESEESEEPEEGSLKALVAQFMNEKEDPFADKQGMPMGGGRSLEIEMTTEKPLAILAKKALKKKGKRK